MFYLIVSLVYSGLIVEEEMDVSNQGQPNKMHQVLQYDPAFRIGCKCSSFFSRPSQTAK
jgi:hypothetical protein